MKEMLKQILFWTKEFLLKYTLRGKKNIYIYIYIYIYTLGEFPGSPVVFCASSAGDLGQIPGQKTKVPQVTWQKQTKQILKMI